MARIYKDTISSPTDAVQKIVTWLQSNGWTVNMNQAEAPGWRAHLSKNGLYVNFRSVCNEFMGSGYTAAQGWGIAFNISAGYNADNSWHTQPGAPLINASKGMRPGIKMGTSGSAPGPLNAIYCYTDPDDNVYIITEGYPGIASYMIFGNLIKIGGWTGGAFMAATRPSSSMLMNGLSGGYTERAPCPFYNGSAHAALIRMDVDAMSGNWIGVGSGGAEERTQNTYCARTPLNYINSGPNCSAELARTEIPSYGGLGSNENNYGDFQNRSFNSFNSQHLLLPIPVYVNRDGGGYSLIGRLPNVYYCRATENGLAFGATLVKGTDQFTVFPQFAIRRFE